MGRKRPRLYSSSQLLVVACAISTRGFLQPPTSVSSFHTRSLVVTTPSTKCHRIHGRRCGNRRSLALHEQQRRPNARPRPPEFEPVGPEGLGFRPPDFDKLRRRRFRDAPDPNDPLPRTMEEVYRQLRLNPPVDPRTRDEDSFSSKDLEIVQDTVSDVCGPLGDENESWWEENGEDLERVVMRATSDSLRGEASDGKRPVVWAWSDMFGNADDSSSKSEVPAAFSLTAYKAGGAEMLDLEYSAFERTPMALYWDSLPDVGATKRVYAHNAVDRMAALKYMMNCTDNDMHGKAGTRLTGHFLWGYADQLDWMRRSGRLSSTPGSIKIDRDSWWGHASFALAIAPLAAAIESDIWPEGVSILDAEELHRPEMKRAVRAWRRVWQYNDITIAQRLLLDFPVHDTLQEGLRRAQWAAHLESLDAVEALYGASLDALPSAEREFARGWCRAARLFAVSVAHTNLDKLIFPLGAGYPPERILEGEGDAEDAENVDCSVPYRPPELVAEAEADPVAQRNTRRCVRSVRWLGTLPEPTFSALRLLWRRACTSYPARRTATQVLRRACYGGPVARVKAWGRSVLNVFVPNLNYRKLTPPFGVDPAEDVEFDPDFERRDPTKPLPRPPGSYPLNPLQQPWYDGPRPQYRAGGPLEDGDDGLAGAYRGMFPPGREVPDMGFEASEREEKEMKKRLQKAAEARRKILAMRDSRNGEGEGEPAVKTIFM